MKVHLAGYNVDSSMLSGASATPEVISAAYARISRSEKSITELHREALAEVERARRSNQSIIFDMGHSSVAEHAVFNLDLIGISRLLVDTVETVRLASFTEKSQRYVTFSHDYVTPDELRSPGQAGFLESYTALMDRLFAEYGTCYRALLDTIRREHPALPKREQEGRAKEDARYILPLSTKTQLGMTINARSLENLLQRLAEGPLAEADELFRKIYDPVSRLSPSLVRYPGKRHYSGTFGRCPGIPTDLESHKDSLRVMAHTPDGDDLVLAALLFERSGAPMDQCRSRIADLGEEQKAELWSEVFSGMRPWHKVSRAFELAYITFEALMSESCWAQFKRHRMGTMLRQPEAGSAEVIIPYGIDRIGRSGNWLSLVSEAKELRTALDPAVSGYARLNLDPVRVLVKMNLRELYHFVRLRSDEHAQWEIRELSNALAARIREIFPRAGSLLCGKSEFPQKD
jgi:flavin-dependent thymidylate synthase